MDRLPCLIWAISDNFRQKWQNTFILVRFRCFICHIVWSCVLLGSWDIVENKRKKYFSWHSSVLRNIVNEKGLWEIDFKCAKNLNLTLGKGIFENYSTFGTQLCFVHWALYFLFYVSYFYIGSSFECTNRWDWKPIQSQRLCQEYYRIKTSMTLIVIISVMPWQDIIYYFTFIYILHQYKGKG